MKNKSGNRRYRDWVSSGYRLQPEEDHPQDRHEVVAGRKLRVGTEVVRRFPEVGFEFFYVIEGFVGHTAPSQYPGIVRVTRALQGSENLSF